MHPVLFHVGDRAVAAYPTFVVLAALTAVGSTVGLATRRGLPGRRVAAVAVGIALGVLIGARLLHAAVNVGLYATDPGLLVRPRLAGFALYGGLLGGGAVGVALARRLGLDWWRVADVSAVGGLVGIAVLRVGCFLNGCCFGEPSTLPWAVTFPPGSPAWARSRVTEGIASGGLFELVDGHAVAVHPTQLYEAAGALVAGVVVWRLGRRAPAGVAALTGAVLFTVVRALAWSLRVIPATYTAPAWVYPALWVAVIAGCGALAVWRLRAQRLEDVGGGQMAVLERWPVGQ